MPSVNQSPIYPPPSYNQSQQLQQPPPPYSPQTTPDYSAQPSPVNLGNSPTTALGGKIFINPDDGAQIASDGEKVTVTSRQGNTVSYMSANDSFALQRSNGELLGSMSNGTIGIDEGNTEIAVDQQGQVHALTPDGTWMNLGSLQSPTTQQNLSRMIDPTAEKDLLNVAAHGGSLGYLDMGALGFAPSSIQVLNAAQAQKANERMRAQQAAQSAQAAAKAQMNSQANAYAVSNAPPLLISLDGQIYPNPMVPQVASA